MFSGSSLLTLDNKGRFAVPKRLREHLTEEDSQSLILTLDIASPCILIYPEFAWQSVAAKLMKLSDTNKTERAVKRLLLGHAHETQMDNNGRILVPGALKEQCQLTKNVALVGQLNKFELWDLQLWNEQIQSSKQLLEQTDLTEFESLSQFSL
ncbi:division/cell wall cluster transcriptional repressor MraZ [Paraferrimonas sp. SM1919]|uniref:division/cell wall cluster transcriptional repressor MraZ n=1 Tax=Paraferrimonas sp. SM1919 TaxID=2662263 RepID=UPI0013CFACF3|nr:division/cell wall cluster transcriptional repressor MraZ [Paraferrimonas sp. SM1919]